MQEQPPMETTVKSYDNAKAYAKDLQKMQAQGWTVQNMLDHQNERSLAGKLLLPYGMLTKGKSQIVVTYQRPKPPAEEQMPKGLSFREQVQWHKDQAAIKAGMPPGLSLKEQIQWKKDHPNRK